jgi:predicted MFS family arabinose efflux permease
MTLVASSLILGRGWRAAYIMLGLPMVVVVVPLTTLMVRSRPPAAVPLTVAEGAARLEGFEVLHALRARSFWMLVIAHLCFGFAAAGTVVHMVAYLEGVGYKPASAAVAMSLFFGIAALGKVTMGYVADRISARLALAVDFAATALAYLLIFEASHLVLLAVFIVVFGAAAAAPLVLLPLLCAESLGRRRYGVLAALTGIAGTIGATVGPVVAGRIFDMTGNYVDAFELLIMLDIIGAVVAFTCEPYASQISRISVAPVPASA